MTARITKSLWRYITNATHAAPSGTDLIGYAPQPGAPLVTDIKECTVSELVAAGGGGTVIRDVAIGELDGAGDNVFIDPANYNLFRLAISGKFYTLMFDLNLGDASGGGGRASMLLGLPANIPQIFDNGGVAGNFVMGRFGSSVGPAMFLFAGEGNYIDLGFGLRNYLQFGSVVNFNTAAFVNWTASPGSDHVMGTLSFTTV